MARPKKKTSQEIDQYHRDGAEDDNEHMIEAGSVYDWARKVSEEEAAGLD